MIILLIPEMKMSKEPTIQDGGYKIHYSCFDDHMIAANGQSSMTVRLSPCVYRLIVCVIVYFSIIGC